MKRRNLIFGLLGLVATAAARAEQRRKVYRIAIVDPVHSVSIFTEKSDEPLVRAFFKEFRRLGYVEGDSLFIERYSGEGRAAHYADLARDVVRRNPDVIITASNNLVLDFKTATATIPIVGIMAVPVEAGIVASLARPGGNITGATVSVGLEQWGKRLQLLQQVVPHATRFGYLETRATREQWKATRPEPTGGTWVGPPLDHPVDESEFRRVFAALVEYRAEGIVVSDDIENGTNFKLIVELAEKNRLPAIYTFKYYVQAGGLMAYGIDFPAVGDVVANIVDRILKGEKPSEIPIFQPTKFELAINLKTAKALGVTVPPELLATADDVTE
jgi:putative tryptophan/tyrosine transport system substrate-binding protein